MRHAYVLTADIFEILPRRDLPYRLHPECSNCFEYSHAKRRTDSTYLSALGAGCATFSSLPVLTLDSSSTLSPIYHLYFDNPMSFCFCFSFCFHHPTDLLFYIPSVACNLLLPVQYMDHIVVNAHTCPTSQATLELLNRESEVRTIFARQPY